MDLKWRKRAHIVARFDMIITMTRLVAFSFLAKEANIDQILMDVEASLLTILITVGPFLSLAILSFRHIWTSARLMKVTIIVVKRSHAAKIIRISQNWLRDVILLLVIELVNDMFNGTFLFGGITLFIRGIFIYDVCNFIAELRRAA